MCIRDRYLGDQRRSLKVELVKPPDLKLFYAGEKFYWESGTMMSALYSEDGRRSDWGEVEQALKKGLTVLLRPATTDELAQLEERLKHYAKPEA